MRICTRTSTGKIIEAQSDATEGTLIANAVLAGFQAGDVTEAVVSDAEYAARMAAQAPAPPSAGDRAAAALAGNDALKGFVRFLAGRFGMTEAQVVEEIKAKAEI